MTRRPERDTEGRPTCWLCRAGMAVAWWRTVTGARRGEMYRPCCNACLDADPGENPPADCDVCGHPTGYATPPPDGRGTWTDWVTVCSIRCLNQAKAEREPPAPEPRRCAWCGGVFTPKRHGSTAGTCSARCRQARHRSTPIPDDADEIRALLDELGLEPPPDGRLSPRLADAVADAIDQLANANPRCQPTATESQP